MKIFCMSDIHTGGRAQPNHWCVCKVIFEKVSVILMETIDIVNILLQTDYESRGMMTRK